MNKLLKIEMKMVFFFRGFLLCLLTCLSLTSRAQVPQISQRQETDEYLLIQTDAFWTLPGSGISLRHYLAKTIGKECWTIGLGFTPGRPCVVDKGAPIFVRDRDKILIEKEVESFHRTEVINHYDCLNFDEWTVSTEELTQLIDSKIEMIGVLTSIGFRTIIFVRNSMGEKLIALKKAIESSVDIETDF